MSAGRLVCAASAWETPPRRALPMAPRPLAADNQSDVNLLGDLIDRPGH
jgi:hypothetical protein